MQNVPPTKTETVAPIHELPKQYKPGEHEGRVWDAWIRAGAFHADPERVIRSEARPFAIVIPPPNVTDRLHLGHALNNTLQDILVRAHRMMGFETLWMPGTDHAGIATQAVVEKRLRASGELKGALRDAMTREQFVQRTQAFKDEYEAVITGQLQKMGCSCDWERQRFTMDEQCARAVREAFFIFFRDGLIYRGQRLVNWDPVLQTAVADDECFDEEIDGAFYYLRYPLVGTPKGEIDPQPVTWNELARRGYPGAGGNPGEQQAWVTVATTRPETYLGDTAVAVNPHDPRAKSLRGLYVELPLVGRTIPLVEDSYVVLPEHYARTDEEKNDPKAGMATGFLKVTPAHDPNDYELGHRHKAAIEAAGNPVLVNIFAPDATISDKHGWTDTGDASIFLGLSREDARKKVVAEFKSHGLLEGIKPHRHSVKHSDRSKAIIEPYLSDQWYVRVTDPRLAASANDALAPEQRSSSSPPRGAGGPPASTNSGSEGEKRPAKGNNLRFHPDRYAKTYEQWHDNIRDWCISRQLWWGHRVPVWSYEGPCGFEPQLDVWSRERRICWKKTSEAEAPRFVVCIRQPDDAVERMLYSNGFRQDPDVLDTWFSSALWPLSTMGWPEETPLLKAFNPTSVLCTAREIITLWVSRMVMFNRYLYAEGGGHGPLPFHDVFIHAVIQDGHGQKMSKSLGNGVDPLDIIASHGADAMRFTLCHMTTQTQDVRMPVDLVCPHTGEVFAPKMITNKDGYTVAAPVQESPKDKSKKMVTVYGVASGEVKPTPEMPLAKTTSSKFDLGRSFATKLWNATRFALGILDRTGAGESSGPEVDPANLSLVDRWMLSRLEGATRQIEEALRSYQFSAYAQALYDIVWRDFCDWYLEGIKPTVDQDKGQRAVLVATLQTLLRLAHPIMPFVTEVLFEAISAHPAASKTPGVRGLRFTGARGDARLLCSAGWPAIDPALRDEEAEREFELARALVSAIREVRAQHTVPFSRKIVLHMPGSLGKGDSLVRTLAGVAEITPQAPAGASVAFAIDAAEYRVSNLTDAVDADAERARLTRAIADKEKGASTLEGRLANPGYTDRAPPALVQQTRDQLAKARAELETLRAALKSL